MSQGLTCLANERIKKPPSQIKKRAANEQVFLPLSFRSRFESVGISTLVKELLVAGHHRA